MDPQTELEKLYGEMNACHGRIDALQGILNTLSKEIQEAFQDHDRMQEKLMENPIYLEHMKKATREAAERKYERTERYVTSGGM